MEITVAKSAGFCFGVKRAVNTVYNAAKSDKKVYTYGPVIHNDEVIKDLERQGVKVINNIEELNLLDGGTIVIRSHGVSEEVYNRMINTHFNVIDTTCPFVLKIHKIVKESSMAGRKIIVIGDARHPEVEGIVGWSSTPAEVICENEQAESLSFPPDEKLCIVAQTTFNYKKFKELVEIISKKGYDIIVLNTICNATEERQSEAMQLARESDAVVVIGGKQSSNTRKLYEISKKECENTYYIQTLSDLDLKQFKSFRRVGITAGASTPNQIIEEVHTNVRIKF